MHGGIGKSRIHFIVEHLFSDPGKSSSVGTKPSGKVSDPAAFTCKPFYHARLVFSRPATAALLG